MVEYATIQLVFLSNFRVEGLSILCRKLFSGFLADTEEELVLLRKRLYYLVSVFLFLQTIVRFRPDFSNLCRKFCRQLFRLFQYQIVRLLTL